VILKELTERIKTRLPIGAVHIIAVDQDYESRGLRREVCGSDCIANGPTCVLDASRDELHSYGLRQRLTVAAKSLITGDRNPATTATAITSATVYGPRFTANKQTKARIKQTA
jgi:hypothetical protein